MDYNSVSIFIIGNDLKAASYFFTNKKTLDSYLEQYGEDVLVANAYDFDEDDIADMNSEEGFATLFGGSSNPLNPDTEYGCLLHLENKFGASANILISATTDAAPAEAPAAAPARMNKNNETWKCSMLKGVDLNVRPSQGWGVTRNLRQTKDLTIKEFELK